MTIRLADKPDSTQVSLAVGHAAPGERCPERNELFLANHIFGSANFSSRLMTRIRSADGRTYGVASQLLSETDFGAFLITTSTQNNRLHEVVRSIIDEHRRFRTEGVTAEEVEKAKQFAIGNMAFQFELWALSWTAILWLRFIGKLDSYLERFPELIAGITLDAVNAAIHSISMPPKA